MQTFSILQILDLTFIPQNLVFLNPNLIGWTKNNFLYFFSLNNVRQIGQITFSDKNAKYLEKIDLNKLIVVDTEDKVFILDNTD